ncbi:hypothetical protein [Compostimonas suwonensis]|uniref:Uncharacterized protein n=1 Tax=Compostimonas suwonensis TaxID=1048394 RepID=A0A2M9BCF8_9MICO|nr:hypothetical protein [Compostimonas suwonensis]PJJ55621.1 hypothetical protein CLV54_2968 [Compostimonas suwonensis]
MTTSRSTRLMAAVAGAGLIALALSGCGTPPWEQAQLQSSASSTPTSTPTIEPLVNELATGSTERKLVAGDAALTVRYWSSLSMDQWTVNANKPISFGLSATLGTDAGQGVYLSKVTLVPAVAGESGALAAPGAVSDQANVSPGYSIKDPYSYSQTFILPAVDPAATSMTLSFTYELLIQTTPTSTEYSKQTASDTLTIAIAP